MPAKAQFVSPQHQAFPRHWDECQRDLIKIVTELASRGIPPEVVTKWLVLFTIHIIESPAPGKRAKQVQQARWRSVRRFPQRLLSLADELKRILEDALWDPRKWLPLYFGPFESKADIGPLLGQGEPNKKHSREEVLTDFICGLPQTLELCADFLQRQSMHVGQHRKYQRGGPALKHYVVAFIHVLRGSSTRDCLPQVARLLQIAYSLAGHEPVDIDPSLLSRWYTRYPEFRRLPDIK